MRRKGAITVSLDVWHLDVLDFLELRLENKDMRMTCHDIFPQLVVVDEFMRRVEGKANWLLVDPYEVEKKLGYKLYELWGKDFEEAYAVVEEAYEDGVLEMAKQISAKEILIKIIKSYEQSGLPYIFFKDTVNKYNPNKGRGYIPAGNLCLSPETKILTRNGQVSIGRQEGNYVSVWNGSEWSEVLVRKTGENQPLLKVRLDNNVDLECTYYHNFYVYRGSRPGRGLVKVEAQDLKPGDVLINFELPVVEGGLDFPYAYTHGFFTGDGHYHQEGPMAYLHGEKQELVPFLNVRNKTHVGFGGTKELQELAVTPQPQHFRTKVLFPKELAPKFTVPLSGYSLESRLEWLAGLLDADGSTNYAGDLCSLAVSSINLEFLREVRLMLQTLGVNSRIGLGNEEGKRIFRDKTDKSKTQEYPTQKLYYLYISPWDTYNLINLGLKTNRLSLKAVKPSRKGTSYSRVNSVEFTGRISDTFCFTEPKRHLGMFNGILTGQCQESYSNVLPQKESHVCNLASINLANIGDRYDLERAVSAAIRMLDNSIELTNAPIESTANHNRLYRTVGLGDMGLADYLAKRKVKYCNEPDSLKAISDLEEDIAFFAYRTSVELAAERGAFEAYSDSEYAKGKILCHEPAWFDENSKMPLAWRELFIQMKKYGVRNSQVRATAPNTSTALLQGCSPSFLPVRSRFYLHKKGNGFFPVCPPHLKESFWFYKEANRVSPFEIIDVASTMQRWLDTGISCELLVDLNNPEVNAVYFRDLILHAWKKEVKALYYIRFIQKDSGEISEKQECSTCAN